MAPATRPEGQLNINLSGLPPITEPTSSTTAKTSFGGTKTTNGSLASLNNVRVGAGSPSHEQTSRLFPKRTRELATPAGVSSNIWGPPTSGTSTPLFEIPESPDHDGFPDLVPLTENGMNSPARRGRAGTLPSRISPVGNLNSHSLTSKTSRPTPSTSPFRPNSTSAAESAFNSASVTAGNSSNSVLLSRLRAGSMPQKPNAIGSGGAFGQSPFSSAWSSRSRAATLTSIHSAEEGLSPQQSGQSRDGLADSARTLDYLGLAETSYPSDSDPLNLDGQSYSNSSVLNNLNSRTSNRFRSFSVNTQPKYNANGHDNNSNFPVAASGTLTPSAQAALEAEYEAVQERVRLHNQAVQAFALNARAARPRASTAGLVDTPQRLRSRRYGQGDIQDAELNADGTLLNITSDPSALTDAFYDMTLAEGGRAYDGQEDIASQISRSLWIGSIPNSTTVSSLDAIFTNYGSIESTRVLTHKNCGFVNFENVQDAVRARQLLNGKEIFPGAGPVRIGFAKAPTASASLESGQNTNSQSPALDVFGGKPGPGTTSGDLRSRGDSIHGHDAVTDGGNNSKPLSEMQAEIMQIVTEFGAQQGDLNTIFANIDSAAKYQDLVSDIPPIHEPSASRTYDAPRLRDIRKRIDNGACSNDEIEHVALDMLPEIAELASDYLGNTVVQKLFEYCSENVKEQMLTRIAPHLAEIGIHKNGTWAAQKIIEVCKTESQTRLIVDSLRPYTVPLFLDQYGNYVLQCCLKFGAPYNDFIFETMLSQLWEVAQGRFGARAMRACLESHQATKSQQRMLAAAIALHAVKLATNANGALLLTWLLDTCTFPQRRSVLAPRLLSSLTQLCTHKVAYLTVLKIVNQRNEPEARELVVNTLFFSPSDANLEQILSDQASGVTLIFKILTNPFLDDDSRPEIMQKIAAILERIKAQPNQGYKRLMDEVGLSARQPQASAQAFTNHAHPAAKPQTNAAAMQYGSFGMNPANFDPPSNLGRTASNESFGYLYGANGFPSQTSSFSNVPYQQMSLQNHYNGFAQPRGNNAFMNNQFGGYGSPSPSVDALRGGQNTASPLTYQSQMSPLMGAGSFSHQGYAQPNGNMYAYNNNGAQAPGYYFSPPMQTVHAGARGRRR